MTQTVALTVNTALALALIGALAVVVRLAHRPPATPSAETFHPSKPLEPTIVHSADRDEFAHAA